MATKKLITVGNVTLYDLNDITVSPTAPSNPTDGQLWCDTSGNAPHIIKKYNAATATWESTTYGSLEEMDPTAAQQVSDAYNGITDLDADNKLTRFERSLVRGELANYIGKYLSGTDSMPTMAQIDSNQVGAIYALRLSAVNTGLPTTDAAYTGLATAYSNLSNYLSGLSPKGWDIDSDATGDIDKTQWDQYWNAFYAAYNQLNAVTQARQQTYADNAAAAIQNANQWGQVTLANPTLITAQLNTLALPFFNGQHVDSWSLQSRNLALGTASPVTLTGVGTTNNTAFLYNVKTAILGSSGTITISFDYTLADNATFTNGTTPSFYVQLKGAVDTGGTTHWDALTTSVNLSSARSGHVSYTRSKVNMSVSGNTVPLQVRMDNVTGNLTISNFKIVVGTVEYDWDVAPEESMSNRIVPITTPTFSAADSLSINANFYGDGTYNDSFTWDSQGNALKNKWWEDINIDGDYAGTFSADATGYKVLAIPNFVDMDIADSTIKGVKYDGSFLSTVTTFTAGDQVKLINDDKTLYISVKDTDSGWGESYTPTDSDILAYFMGWKVCNGTYGQAYTGSGNAVWYPIGDTDLSRSTMSTSPDGTVNYQSAPSTLSPAVGTAINLYQMVYRYATGIQDIVTFDGVLSLIQGDNQITITVPNNTPSITSGYYKFATSLGTVAQGIQGIIPTIQHRIKSVEQDVTSDAIVNTVTQSTEFQYSLAGKANSSDLSGYTPVSDFNDYKDNVVPQTLQDALKSLDFTPYVTSTTLEQTVNGVKDGFHRAGGNNLIRNSVGYIPLSEGAIDPDTGKPYKQVFWQDYIPSSGTPEQVQTIQNDDLYTLGFGSGFWFPADGVDKGISQDVAVVPGIPYSLSWYLQKTSHSTTADSTYSFAVQILENGVITNQINDNSTVLTNGYDPEYFVFTPQGSLITVRFIAYKNCEATLSGIMLTPGTFPIPWSLATGENYNTNITFDINGIRVTHFDDSGDTNGYTEMTDKEFSGWNKKADGSYEKVFYINGDETTTKKLSALNEISMGEVKIINVNSSTRKGWAIIPT